MKSPIKQMLVTGLPLTIALSFLSPSAASHRAQAQSQQRPAWVVDPAFRPPPPTRMPPVEDTLLTNMIFRPVEPGVFELGKLRFSKRERSIKFPAFVNTAGGPLEYFLVTTYGKTHESVLRTEIEPIHLQLAFLLLDAKGDPQMIATHSTGTNAETAPRNPIADPSGLALKGDQVQLEVAWTAEGLPKICQAGQLVVNLLTGKPLQPAKWVYNGSLVLNGQFIAQRDGSIISLITDQMALINNVAPGHENDDIWTVSTNQVPPMNTPVEITIRLNISKGTQGTSSL